MSKNGVMLQFFEWYLPNNSSLWKKAVTEAENLKNVGFTAIWLPPAYKGQAGLNDVGYGVYDLYDLGEFNQKGTVATKYGTKEEYLKAIKALQGVGIDVYADIVLNHKMGADGIEEVTAVENDSKNRLNVISAKENIEAWTKFDFPNRNNKYSDFKWNCSHFDGVDWDQRRMKSAIYCFDGGWDLDVDSENVNYDYLMGADLNFRNKEVLEELDRWGQWYVDTTGVDGFRLDAVKHISFGFFKNWLKKLRENNNKEFFAVGEYWSKKLEDLQSYLRECEGTMSLFDVPLHMNFFYACNSGGKFNMADLLKGTLVADNPVKAVTFVENHDTQEGQALQTVVATWFKPLAYAVILLRNEGYPCVFYGDYYGIPTYNIPPMRDTLDLFLKIRKEKVFGTIHNYFDDCDIVGWTLEGDNEHINSGVAVLMSDAQGGSKNMYIGEKFSGKKFIDCTQGISEQVTIDSNGCGLFSVNGGSVSVWILKE